MTLLDATATATITDVTAYCNDIIAIINIVITKCRLIPSGHKFLDTNIIAAILFKILCEINFTLRLLLSKCGLRMCLYSSSSTTCVVSAHTNIAQWAGSSCSSSFLSAGSSQSLTNSSP